MASVSPLAAGEFVDVTQAPEVSTGDGAGNVLLDALPPVVVVEMTSLGKLAGVVGLLDDPLVEPVVFVLGDDRRVVGVADLDQPVPRVVGGVVVLGSIPNAWRNRGPTVRLGHSDHVARRVVLSPRPCGSA